MLRSLRHGPLTFYLALVVASSLVLGLALVHGSINTSVKYGTTPDRVTLQGVLDRMGELKSLEAASHPNLQPWAHDVVVIADNAYQRRSLAYGKTDALALAWHALSVDATALATAPVTSQITDAQRVEGDVVTLETEISLPVDQRLPSVTLPPFPSPQK